MTMAYLASFDLDTIGAGLVTLSTSGKSDIAVNLSTWDQPNYFGTATTKFNHVIGHLNAPALGSFYEITMPAMPALGLLASLTFAFRDAADTATWTDPNSIFLSIDTTTWLVSFFYSGNLTGITFGNTETRRLFGFSGNFSGSSATVTGTQVPKYIIVPVVDGASSATPRYEQGSVGSAAYSGTGRPYSVARSSSVKLRDWTQQYETKGKTFRQFSLAIPDEFTWQHFFEQGRAGLPFGVYGGFGNSQYEAYLFRAGSESFHPYPAVPGSSNQFHIPFRTYALGAV